MYMDVAEYISNCPQYQVAKGHYTGPKTILGSHIANNPLNLLCFDFKEMDP